MPAQLVGVPTAIPTSAQRALYGGEAIRMLAELDAAWIALAGAEGEKQ